MDQHAWRTALILVTFALALRGTVLLLALLAGRGWEAFREPDSASYLETARALAERGEFSRHGEPEILRTPGYPVFLAPASRLEEPLWLIVPLQLALSAGTVGLLFAVAHPLLGRRGALWCAVLYACEPLAVAYTGKALSETLFAALLVLWLLSVVRPSNSPSSALRLLLPVLILAAAAYVRPVLYYFPALFALAWAIAGHGVLKQRAIATAVTLAACAAVLGSWQVRNRLQADFGGFSSVADVNLYFWHRAAVQAASDERSLRSVQQDMGLGARDTFDKLHPELREASPGERARFMRDDGLRTIRAEPRVFLLNYADGLWGTLTDPGTSAYVGLFDTEQQEQSSRSVRRVVHSLLMIMLVALYLLAASGVWRLRRDLVRWPWVAVVALAVYLVALSGGPVGYHRLRHPVMPIVCLLAAVGATRRIAIVPPE